MLQKYKEFHYAIVTFLLSFSPWHTPTIHLILFSPTPHPFEKSLNRHISQPKSGVHPVITRWHCFNIMGLSAPYPECIFKGIDYYGMAQPYKQYIASSRDTKT